MTMQSFVVYKTASKITWVGLWLLGGWGVSLTLKNLNNDIYEMSFLMNKNKIVNSRGVKNIKTCLIISENYFQQKQINKPTRTLCLLPIITKQSRPGFIYHSKLGGKYWETNQFCPRNKIFINHMSSRDVYTGVVTRVHKLSLDKKKLWYPNGLEDYKRVISILSADIKHSALVRP